MTLEMARAGARPAPAHALPDDQSPPNDVNTANVTRLRVPVEIIPPDRARRRGYLVLLRHCPNCSSTAGGYVHAFRSMHWSASYVRRPPCGGPELVLVAGSMHLRQVVA